MTRASNCSLPVFEDVPHVTMARVDADLYIDLATVVLRELHSACDQHKVQSCASCSTLLHHSFDFALSELRFPTGEDPGKPAVLCALVDHHSFSFADFQKSVSLSFALGLSLPPVGLTIDTPASSPRENQLHFLSAQQQRRDRQHIVCVSLPAGPLPSPVPFRSRTDQSTARYGLQQQCPPGIDCKRRRLPRTNHILWALREPFLRRGPVGWNVVPLAIASATLPSRHGLSLTPPYAPTKNSWTERFCTSAVCVACSFAGKQQTVLKQRRASGKLSHSSLLALTPTHLLLPIPPFSRFLLFTGVCSPSSQAWSVVVVVADSFV